MSSIPDHEPDDDSYKDHFVQLSQPFQDSMLKEGKSLIMTRAALYDAEGHETISMLSVSATTYDVCDWRWNQWSIHVNRVPGTPWSSLWSMVVGVAHWVHITRWCIWSTGALRRIVHCRDVLLCILAIPTEPVMSICTVWLSYVESKHSHDVDRYRDVLFEHLCFGEPGAPMPSTVHISNVMDVSWCRAFPQSTRQPRNLPCLDKWLAVKEEEKRSTRLNKVTAHTFCFFWRVECYQHLAHICVETDPNVHDF